MRYELSNGKDRVYQWDHDITITITEPDDVPEVHFRWGGKAVPLTVTNQQVEIPPELLQQPKDIVMWAYTPDHTMDMARIPMEKRPKPSDYAYTPTEIKTWEQLDERIEALEQGGGVAGVSSVNGQTGTVTITAEGLGALTKDDLQSATNAALAQAKASGAFDGAQGPKGETGAQGPAGPTGPAGAGLDVTGATVGQIVKIAAVDSNGVPTAWEPVDMASGADEIEELIQEIPLTADVESYIIADLSIYKKVRFIISKTYINEGTGNCWLNILSISGGSIYRFYVPSEAIKYKVSEHVFTRSSNGRLNYCEIRTNNENIHVAQNAALSKYVAADTQFGNLRLDIPAAYLAEVVADAKITVYGVRA